VLIASAPPTTCRRKRRSVRFGREVRQFVFDEEVPLEFDVYPGNNGQGVVEITVAVVPTLVGNEDTYGNQLGLPEPYSVPIQDYVLYRCQMKDDDAAAAGRSAGHYQMFATAVGIKIQVEGSSSPNNRRAK
jgi:hypothetical protein